MQLEKVKQYFIDCNASLIDALKQMDLLDCKLLIVIKEGEYFNLLSVGDVQRKILKDGTIESIVSDALRSKVKVGKTSESIKTHREMMMHYRMAFLPILNTANKLVDVLFWDDLIEKNSQKSQLKNSELENIPLVIMAGGQGTRLKPITNVIPKPLVPLGEKPIIETIIDSFLIHGCKDFHVSVNYKAELIKFHFDSLENKTYDINYFKEDQPLGTAGSLQLLKGEINNTFFVSNCDIFIEEDYRQILKYHKESNNELTAVAAVKSFSIPYGTMEIGENGTLLSLTEKPELTYYVNAGLYVLEPHLIDEIPVEEFFHITHLMEKIKKRKGTVGVFPVTEKSWLDIGEWESFYASQNQFNRKK